MEQLIYNLVASHDANVATIERKLTYLRRTQRLSAFEVTYLAVVLIALPYL